MKQLGWFRISVLLSLLLIPVGCQTGGTDNDVGGIVDAGVPSNGDTVEGIRAFFSTYRQGRGSCGSGQNAMASPRCFRTLV